MDTDFSFDIFEKVDDGLERCGNLYVDGKVYPYTAKFTEKITDICIENSTICYLCIATDLSVENVMVEFDNGWKVAPANALTEQLTRALCAFYGEME